MLDLVRIKNKSHATLMMEKLRIVPSEKINGLVEGQVAWEFGFVDETFQVSLNKDKPKVAGKSPVEKPQVMNETEALLFLIAHRKEYNAWRTSLRTPKQKPLIEKAKEMQEVTEKVPAKTKAAKPAKPTKPAGKKPKAPKNDEPMFDDNGKLNPAFNASTDQVEEE